MLEIVLIIVLWTWGLTPLWANIIGTILLSVRLMLTITKDIVKIIKEEYQEK